MTRARRPRRSPLARRAAVLRHRAGRLDPTVKGLLWASFAGFQFVVLNTLVRALTLDMHPMQAQFLRYVFAVLVMVPFVLHAGVAAYMPKRIGGQFAFDRRDVDLDRHQHLLQLIVQFTRDAPALAVLDAMVFGHQGAQFGL